VMPQLVTVRVHNGRGRRVRLRAALHDITVEVDQPNARVQVFCE
jgi:hypothetical protein